ncbi:hypothetical protein O181_100629 [Austropuccinia psidii MF-1]|uniref:Uncharacterized protein n=1 Tax=Austropuccinia psidii MF-1 TaxID=1389203 RepID=A0A9Q3PGK6_9BASI|nr:hypothetical protein [Austropuccinia psidii MF-1]
MRIDHGKHDWSWWKSEVITKCANNSWRFKMENAFESAIFNSEKDKPLTWFFKQKDRLSALHPDMSDTMIKMKILEKCGGELEHSIKADVWNHVQQRTILMKWNISLPEQELPTLVPKKTKINEAQVIEGIHCTEETEESDQDSAVSEDTPVEGYPIQNIKSFFVVTEVHTHLSQYSEDCHNLINIQDARMCKTKPARGKGYTAGASCITSILMNNIESKVNVDTGAFCTCVGKDYLQVILPEWKTHELPIEGVQFSCSSNNMYPLGILDTNIVFPHPAGSIGMKTAIVVMDNCTS